MHTTSLFGALGSAAFMLWGVACTAPDELPQHESTETVEMATGEGRETGRSVVANVVAIDQVYVYNRFGAFNPAGMIYALERDVVPIREGEPLGPGNAMLRRDKRPRPLVLRVNVGDKLVIRFTNLLNPEDRRPDDSTRTRSASIHVTGLQIRNIEALGGNVGQGPDSLAMPGQTVVYELFAAREGSFLMHSSAAMAGGEGDGGQVGLGLFGAINVEPPGAVAYRSQVTSEELRAASMSTPNPDGTPRVDHDALDEHGEPILRIINDRNEIVHGDLNAIITGYAVTRTGTPASRDQGRFRELTIVFHDELKAVQAFPELDQPTFQGGRDGFGINYGAAGIGAEILANRARLGPSKQCVECKFEEFFLSSWPNGDPAMIVERDRDGRAARALFPDDPSNVHHGYLGDPVRFRNLHAGPKETHVFHLHGHQWLKTQDNDNSLALDAQTLGPGAAFNYDIIYGGGGNRNLTAGDAIFHCHLYPHFAQGMWGLWRNHDVFEAGTPDRSLPDGEIAGGTPVPAVVPIPGLGMPPMPTYEPSTARRADGTTEIRPAMPGYPFYIAALAGHRPPQPPLDLAIDGGLPRHLVTSVPPGGATFGARGRFDVELDRANIKLLPQDGTPAEQAAADFHAGRFPGAVPFTTIYDVHAQAYPAFTPEGAPSRFVVNGQPPAPGAPYADPCPPGAPERRYRVGFVQIDAVVNRRGWHDPQARIEVLEEDIEATLNGERPPEPLFVRANSGECVVVETTNLIPDALEEDPFQIFTPTDIMGQHVHLVKFDVTSSDGAANGFNYEDGTFAAREVVARIEAANALGGAFEADGTLAERGARVRLRAERHPRIRSPYLGLQTTVQRWWVDPLLNDKGDDLTVNTAFAHDHFSPSSHQQHGFYMGLIAEPAGSTWRDPETGTRFGTRADGGPTSFRADILTPTGGPEPPFREFGMQLADFALLFDECGNPVNPPTAMEAPLPVAVEHPEERAPELVSARDPGGQLINYRNEPIPLRIAERDCRTGHVAQRTDTRGDMHNVFSSTVHGDPYTPLLRAHEGDSIRMRLLQGAHEEQHLFTVHGKRWLNMVDDPDSGYSNGQTLGISERFELAIDGIASHWNPRGVADHLYQSAATDDLWDGMWGILRILPRTVGGLLPLPAHPHAPPTPPRWEGCPASAPVRSYVVHAITARENLPGDRLTYNEEFQLYDPDAILFVRSTELDEVRSGARRPEPLILRAAAGDCVEVTLQNDLPRELPRTPHWNYSPPIVDGFNTNQVRSSNHVSLHPQLVMYDVTTDDGANVGFNEPQTVPPGESRTYTWYAGEIAGSDGRWGAAERRPVEFGVINLKDMADVVNHGMHGAVGALIIEPRGSSWTSDPGTHAQADVTFRDEYGYDRSFREFVVVYHDEVGMHSDDPRFQCAEAELRCGTAIRNYGAEDDAEDTGHKAFNYRTEPFWARLGVRPEEALEELGNRDLRDIFSSEVHGDPATPIFKARARDRLRVRLVYPSGHRRQHAFGLWGTVWPDNPFAEGTRSRRIGNNPETITIGIQDGLGPMAHRNVVPFFRAGGQFAVTGDRLYLDQPSFKLSDGLWGIFRVTP